MLRTAAKFHNYSFNNQLLIFLQRPDATHVAGFHRWKSLGRTVKKGEKGIAIFAPCKYKSAPPSDNPSGSSSGGKGKSESGPSGSDLAVKVRERSESTEDGFHLRGFRVAYVFDISHTEGEPLTDLDAVRPKLLEGSAPEGIWHALITQATAAGFEVIRHQRGSENGYCDFLAKKIAVRPDVEDLQAIKTLVHELGHALLHSGEARLDRARQEIEVESVAFVVLETLGLGSDDYSFPYVARWASGDVDKIKETGERVVGCASQILRRLEELASCPPHR